MERTNTILASTGVGLGTVALGTAIFSASMGHEAEKKAAAALNLVSSMLIPGKFLVPVTSAEATHACQNLLVNSEGQIKTLIAVGAHSTGDCITLATPSITSARVTTDSIKSISLVVQGQGPQMTIADLVEGSNITLHKNHQTGVVVIAATQAPVGRKHIYYLPSELNKVDFDTEVQIDFVTYHHPEPAIKLQSKILLTINLRYKFCELSVDFNLEIREFGRVLHSVRSSISSYPNMYNSLQEQVILDVHDVSGLAVCLTKSRSYPVRWISLQKNSFFTIEQL